MESSWCRVAAGLDRPQMAALEKISRKKGAAAPLFILSFRRRDELMQAAEKGGWLPIAARRSKGAETRFLASGAALVVVDAREALEEAREGVRALAQAVEANGAALLLLVAQEDAAELEDQGRPPAF